MHSGGIKSMQTKCALFIHFRIFWLVSAYTGCNPDPAHTTLKIMNRTLDMKFLDMLLTLGDAIFKAIHESEQFQMVFSKRYLHTRRLPCTYKPFYKRFLRILQVSERPLAFCSFERQTKKISVWLLNSWNEIDVRSMMILAQWCQPPQDALEIIWNTPYRFLCVFF